MLNQILSAYISAQALLSLGFIISFMIYQFSLVKFEQQLKSTYFLMVTALALPILIQILPMESSYLPIVKMWQETNPVSKNNIAPQVMFSLTESLVTPGINSSIHINYGVTILFVILLSILVFLIRLSLSFYKTQKLLKSAFNYKKIQQTEVKLCPDSPAPFSFYNGKAQVILPYELLQNPKNMTLALKHELQHHRQKDTLFVYLLELIKIFFALNPLVKKWISTAVELQELACDEALIGQKSVDTTKYSKCLYSFAYNQLFESKLTGAVGMASQKKFLLRRIQIMYKQKRKASKFIMTLIGLTAMFSMASLSWSLQNTIGTHKLNMAQLNEVVQKVNQDSEIPIVVDELVLNEVNRIVSSERSRNYMKASLKRMQIYKAMIQSKLEKSDLPIELLAVPMLESGYINNTESTHYAKGIWQFIASTARNYNLVVNGEVDERLNPSKLTNAAISYYKSLHSAFQNWHVSLVAYNIGEHRMLRIISKEKTNDILELSRKGKLGREGSAYLPKFMAALIVIKDPSLLD